MFAASLQLPSTVREGDLFTGSLLLSGYSGTVTYAWSTTPGTATQADFTAAHSGGRMTINSTTMFHFADAINFQTTSDRIDEPDETVYVNVQLTGATFADGSTFASVPVTILDDIARHGTPLNDTMLGGAQADWLIGWEGDDLILGYDGNDTLNGDVGNDTLMGGNGNDLLTGGAGNDRLRGDAGNDTLNGDAGNDVLIGQAGLDRIKGGAGDDVIYAGSEDDIGDGEDGNDFLMGEAGNDLLRGGNGNDKAGGGLGNDTLNGDAGDDRLNGAAGNDKVSGGMGNDACYGGDGNDTLIGDFGYDVLSGGAGSDMFIFRSGTVRVFDYQDDIDTIAITRGVVAGGRTINDLIDHAWLVNGKAHIDLNATAHLIVGGVTSLDQLRDDMIFV